MLRFTRAPPSPRNARHSAFSRTLVALLALALCVAAEAFYYPASPPRTTGDDIVYMR